MEMENDKLKKQLQNPNSTSRWSSKLPTPMGEPEQTTRINTEKLQNQLNKLEKKIDKMKLPTKGFI